MSENGAQMIRWLPLSQIDVSEMQPRKHFDEAGIAELVESFRAHGFNAGVSHLLVRPVGDRFELVCGERRWKASYDLELNLVPAVVQEMDDLSVLKLQLVENMQRESLTPMEEAIAFGRLSELGQSQDEIAQAIGRNREYVKSRMALRRLAGTEVGEALDRGAITARHALAIVTVPSTELRQELLEKVLHPPDGSAAPWNSDVLRSHIKMDYVIDLRTATFDTEDPALVSPFFEGDVQVGGGACGECPFRIRPEGVDKRSSAQACTNPECFRMKVAADHEKWRARVFATTKREALPSAENAELWNESGSSMAFHSPYIDLAHQPEKSELRGDVMEVETWQRLVEGQSVPIVMGRDSSGKVHELVLRDVAKKAAHLNGHMIFRDSKRESKLDDEAAGARSPARKVPPKNAEAGWLALAAIVCEALENVRWTELGLAQLAEIVGKAIVAEYEN